MKIGKTKLGKSFLIGGLLLGGAIMLAGCFGTIGVEERYYYDDGDVFVYDTPPPDRVEVITTCPGPNYIWIGGYWTWRDRWYWRGGYWSARPYPHSKWSHSHWTHEHNGWRYHHGHWNH